MVTLPSTCVVDVLTANGIGQEESALMFSCGWGCADEKLRLVQAWS